MQFSSRVYIHIAANCVSLHVSCYTRHSSCTRRYTCVWEARIHARMHVCTHARTNARTNISRRRVLAAKKKLKMRRASSLSFRSRLDARDIDISTHCSRAVSSTIVSRIFLFSSIYVGSIHIYNYEILRIYLHSYITKCIYDFRIRMESWLWLLCLIAINYFIIIYSYLSEKSKFTMSF